MRFIITIIFIGIFLIIGFTALKIGPDEDTPVKYAKQFLNHLQDGDYHHAVASFGGNICRCPADLGWVSYLIYGSGEEPNLALMMGKRFERGSISYKKMESAVDKSQKALLENPQDFEVDIPIKFDPKIYAPYFLPLDMAYGLPIKSRDFDTFLSDPDKDSWRSMTLRMRPSLEPETVTIPYEAEAEIDHYMKNKKAEEKERREQRALGHRVEIETKSSGNAPSPIEIAAGLAKEALAASAENKFLIPKDAGPVTADDGKALPLETVAARLPRLKSALLKLHMVRRDTIQPFTVFHFVLSDPVLLLPQKNGYTELVLKNFKPPLNSPTKNNDKTKNSAPGPVVK
jgi:hypothetical protein